MDRKRPSMPDAGPDTIIGHDVWIGQGVTVLPGAHIGHGCIIGAKSVVSGTHPPYTILAGNPAKPIRRRFDDQTIKTILDLAWWDWPIDHIVKHEAAICGGDIAALRAAAPLIPWWAYAIFAITLAPTAVEFYEDYQSNEAIADQARTIGPPAVTDVSVFAPSRSAGSFGEVQLSGTLRADLGVLYVAFGETHYSYVVMDGGNSGPLIALMDESTTAETMITRLVDRATSTGGVTVQGFLAPSRNGEVSRRLAMRGETRNVYVVEPYFGSRNAVLAGKVDDAKFSFYIAAGFVALFGLIAVWKYRNWRARRSQKRNVRRKARPRPAPVPQHTPTKPVTQKIGIQDRAADSPWDSFNPQDSNIAPSSNARMVKPQSPQDQKAAQAKAQVKTTGKRSLPRDADVPPPPQEFESVFPGGGSGFRFKSADEIIRQSFGTLSSLNRPQD
ncbi:Chloramphenicol acetyltransferase [Nymphon striatum]|nr:Chloramphenicol acetyltransferase [Nymphon striatum]